jgi:hypothetical protein
MTQPTTKPIQQTYPHSGSKYHISLDHTSIDALRGCIEIHHRHRNPCSNAVIVRRALRFYHGHLEHMDSENIGWEVTETERAAKGMP